MTAVNRRQFLTASVAAGAGLVAAPAAAIEPITRSGPAHLRSSIAAYSYRDYLKGKGSVKPTMTLDDFVDAAAAMDLDAVELTSYYFPTPVTNEYLAKLKGRCTRLGLDVSGTAVGNDFCTPDATKMKQQMELVKTWTEHTARLGGKTMRIFAGNIDKKVATETAETARARCVAAIQEACDHAAQFGVYLALENHGGITGTADQLLAIVKAVKHDWFGVNLDSGNFHTADPYADLARIAPYAVVAQIKTEIQREGKGKEDADLKQLVDMLRAARYRGYVALEYEAAEDPKVAIPRHAEALKKLLRG